MPIWVVDLSIWDGDVSISKLKAAGVGAVIAKCGGGDVGNYRDSKFESNYANCKSAGMPVGTYWYLNATTVAEAKDEAAYCLKLLKGKSIEYPVYVDVETTEHQLMSTNQPGTLAKVIRAFTDKIKAAGYLPGVYSWKWLLEPCGSTVAELEWWVCSWTRNKPCDCGLWQFGGETNVIRSTYVAGYGPMDQSYAYKDYPAITKGGKKKSDQNTNKTMNYDTTRAVIERVVKFPSGINVRDKPSVKNGNVVANYGKNETCIIDGLVLSEGYVWGTYIGKSSGKRRYVALGTTELSVIIQ